MMFMAMDNNYSQAYTQTSVINGNTIMHFRMEANPRFLLDHCPNHLNEALKCKNPQQFQDNKATMAAFHEDFMTVHLVCLALLEC